MLTCHVVPGRLDYEALAERIRAGGDCTTLTTANGQALTAMMNGLRNIVLRDVARTAASAKPRAVAEGEGPERLPAAQRARAMQKATMPASARRTGPSAKVPSAASAASP